jgi:hypothetical protein
MRKLPGAGNAFGLSGDHRRGVPRKYLGCTLRFVSITAHIFYLNKKWSKK